MPRPRRRDLLPLALGLALELAAIGTLAAAGHAAIA
jgi:hypothetical protein